MAQTISIPDTLFRKIETAASSDGVSPSTWIVSTLALAALVEPSSIATAPNDADGWITTRTARGLNASFKRTESGGARVRADHHIDGPTWEVQAQEFHTTMQILKERGSIPLGASRTAPAEGSLGHLLLDKFRVNNASYVAMVLRHEGIVAISPDPNSRGFLVALTNAPS